MGFLWILIPLAGILLAGFDRWLKYKQKALNVSGVGVSADVAALKAALAASEEDRKALARRVQNLEAIVTTEMWDALHHDALPTAERERVVAQAQARLSLPDADAPDADKVEHLAQRLRT